MKKNLLILFLFFLSVDAFSQIDREFWFAAPVLNSTNYNDSVKFCFVSFDQPTLVTISQPANPTFTPITHLMAANDFWEYKLDTLRGKTMLETNDGMVLPFGFHITSENAISAYYAAYGNSSEVYTLKGKNALGTNFLVPSQFTYSDTKYPGSSSIEIVASEDNTDVVIQPSQAVTVGLVNGKINVRLNRGESYCVKASSQTAGSQLRNSTITSTKPIAVNTTEDDVTVGSFSVDLVGNQIVPVNLLGTRYLAIKNNGVGGTLGKVENVYIFPTKDNTNVYVNGTLLTTMNIGNEIMYSLTQATSLITSNNPVVVFQLSSVGNEVGGTILPQIDCTGSTEVAYKGMLGTATENFIVKTAYTGSFLINGQSGILKASDFTVITSDPSLSYCQKAVAAGTNGVLRVKNTAGYFHLSVLDGVPQGKCSYGYFSDFQTLKLNAKTSKEAYLLGDTLKLYLSNPQSLSSITWTKPDGTNVVTNPLIIPNATFANAGMYKVTATSNDVCSITDAGLVVVNIFEPTKSSQKVCSSDSISLTASGAGPYTWNPDANFKDTVTIRVNPQLTTTYAVKNYKLGQNIIENGNFQEGYISSATNASFISNYIYGGTGTSAVTTNGSYSVWKNANEINRLYNTVYDHTTGNATTGQHLIVKTRVAAGEKIWSKTIEVNPDTKYQFSAWFLSAISGGTQAKLHFVINDQMVGDIITPPNTVTSGTYGTQPSQWAEASILWNSGNRSTTTISIVTDVSNTAGSDVCIDDIALCPFLAVTDTILVNVIQTPKPIITGDKTICNGKAVLDAGTLDNGVAYNTYSWRTANNTTQLSDKRLFSVTQPGSYIVEVSNDICSGTGSFQVSSPAEIKFISKIDTVIICPNEFSTSVDYTLVGKLGTYSVFFDNKAKSVGFNNIENQSILTNPKDTTTLSLSIPLPTSIMPDIYSAKLKITKENCSDSVEIPLKIAIKYAADNMLVQRWDDVISVKNAEYNGGYTFTSYQWYKNNIPMVGQTRSYIYDENKFNSADKYCVLLTRKDDGVTLFTCDFSVQQLVASYIPTLVSPSQMIALKDIENQGYASFTDIRGTLNSRQIVNIDNAQIKAPERKGLYILSINTNKQPLKYKIIVK